MKTAQWMVVAVIGALCFAFAGTELLAQDEPRPAKRPRTLAEARQRNGDLPTQWNRPFEVRYTLYIVSVQPMGFDAYDAEFVSVLQECWQQRVEHGPSPTPIGRVVLDFDMSCEGQITNVQAVVYEVGILRSMECERAVRESAPLVPWPLEMRGVVGTKFRRMTVNFEYF